MSHTSRNSATKEGLSGGSMPKLLSLLIVAASAYAQIVSGTISGSVKDSSGAVIAGAKITLLNLNTGLTRDFTSNETGGFLFPTLPPGKYRVSATRPSFRSLVVSDIDLQIDQTVSLDLIMQVGEVTESVSVEASSVVLQTETATVGQVVADKTIVDLPLNGRNFLQLAELSAAVVPATAATSQGALVGRPETTINVAGGRVAFNSYLIDGVDARGSRFGEATFLPDPDVILEFKIQRNFYSAEYGASPAIVSISTKSGTNSFHGSLYEFIRNSDLDSPGYFDHGSPPPFRLNQFGGTVGGPVRSNRTFFFFGYEGRRQRLATQGFATVPSPTLLSGNFSGLSTMIKDPLNGGVPFPNNIIPQSRLNPIAVAFNSYIPAPNAAITQGNYAGAPSATSDFDQYHIRVDHRFSDRDSLFGRYSNSDWSEVTPGLLPYGGVDYPFNSRSVVVQETHIFNPGFLNTVKLGYTRGFLASDLYPVASQNLAAQIGFKNTVIDPVDYSLPRMTLAGYTLLGHAYQTFRNSTNTYSLSDTANLIRGRHSMAFGFDIRNHRDPEVSTNASNGRLTFTGAFTGNSVADYLLGAYAVASGYFSSFEGNYRYSQYALFFQDNYKVSSRLTLNLGLRWEYNQPIRELNGSEGYFDPSIPGLRLANNPSIFGITINSPYIQVGGVQPGIVKPQFLNFAPRFGFAFTLTPKTVIRGGLGIFYAMSQGNEIIEGAVNPGASIGVSLVNSPGQVPRLMNTLFDKITSEGLPAGYAGLFLDPVRKTPYMQQVSLDIQRSLPGSLFFEIGYIANEGHQLWGLQDLNAAPLNAPGQSLSIVARRPFPQFGSIGDLFGGENSNYNAMTASIERRFATGVGLLADYTVGKSLDTLSGSNNDVGHPISNNRHIDYGPSAFDVRQRFAASISYELPFGRGKRYLATTAGLAKWVVSGWQLNSVLQFQSGFPITISEITDRSNTGVDEGALERPNRIASGLLPSGQQNPNEWFDKSAFVVNPLNTYGNSGRGVLNQNGIKTVDFSVLKNSQLTERIRLQFRAELFNIMNSNNFGPPGVFIDGANFGVVTTVGPARQIQFALKLLF